MTRTPQEPSVEELDELDELDDEAIVAQQSAPHSPQPRAQVKVESRSVVVAEEDAEATRELAVYTEGTSDPTLVVRDREHRALSRAMGRMSPQPARKKSWVGLAIWGGAGLFAFALGGIIAVAHGGDSSPAEKASASAAAVVAPAPVVLAAETDAAAEPSASSPAPELVPEKLPVERGKARAKPRRAAQSGPGQKQAQPAQHAF